MKNITDLLAMPDDWEKRPEAWQELIFGSMLFDALRQAVRRQDLEQAVSSVDRWREFVDDRGEQAIRQWKTLSALLVCAQIASLTVDTAFQLPGLLHELELQQQLPDASTCRAAAGDAQRWRQFVRDQFHRFTAPSSAEWAWDSVTLLMGYPRPLKRSESLGVLLVVGGGVTARLTLEQFSDEGLDLLYPDPSTMSFVECGQEFHQAAQDAAAYIHAEKLWRANERIDVRWKLSRQDGRHLISLDGSSAGSAFALGLAKLFAER